MIKNTPKLPNDPTEAAKKEVVIDGRIEYRKNHQLSLKYHIWTKV